MKAAFKSIGGSVVAPQGFLAAGVFCDIKRLGTGKGSDKGRKRDLALVVSEVPAVAAGMFTTNQVCAAPVKVCLEHLKQKKAQALVINSGNANACTGRQGLIDARAMCRITAEALHMATNQVLVASTGRIGVRLPMPNVKSGILSATGLLGPDPAHGAEAAEAILTSDTHPKVVAVECKVGGKKVRIGGMCKGAGMIQPGMSANGQRPAALHATMLCFLTTDAAIQSSTLQKALQTAVAKSFNRITVDGDMSTNDTVLILANGLAQNPTLTSGRGKAADHLRTFQDALNHVCLELAQMIVRDGEGVSRFVTIRLSGARNDAEADAAIRAVGNSALVKTSWFGGDPNWGRIIDALGYSNAKIVENKVDIAYSAPGSRQLTYSLKRGQPTSVSFAKLCRIAAAREFDLHIDLHLGRGQALLYASDLTEAYVDFNKGNVNDPSALGG